MYSGDRRPLSGGDVAAPCDGRAGPCAWALVVCGRVPMILVAQRARPDAGRGRTPCRRAGWRGSARRSGRRACGAPRAARSPRRAAAGRSVHLGRVVVGELVCEHLMHRQVEADRHRLAGDDQLVFAVAQGAIELRVISADHDTPHVRIDEVLEPRADARQRLLAGDQRQPLSQAGARRLHVRESCTSSGGRPGGGRPRAGPRPQRQRS